MSNDQIRRANRVVFPVIAVIMAYVLFTLVAFVAVGGAAAMTGKVLFQLVVTALAMILSIFFCYKQNNT